MMPQQLLAKFHVVFLNGTPKKFACGLGDGWENIHACDISVCSHLSTQLLRFV